MKRWIIVLFLGMAVLSGAAAQSLRGRTVYISTKTTELRSSTGFFAETLGTLEYGEQVAVLQDEGRWLEVRWARRASLTGWILATNITTKRVISSGDTVSASASELALAGKGFSEEVENSYKKDTSVNYTGVDVMETLGISKRDLYDFLQEGHLILGE